MRHLYSKIQIPLTDSQKSLVTTWLDRFHARSIHVWSTPELNSQSLTIHPADFANLVSFAEPGDCSELEFYRLRKLGATVIESTLSNQKNRLSKELKDMALDTLRSLTPQVFEAEAFQEINISDTI